MHADKFVKLSAIEKMAKPMEAIHEEMEDDTVEMTECPKCGHQWSSNEDAEDVEENEEY